MRELLDDLGTLIAFPTVSNRPLDALAAWLSERMAKLGFRIETFVDPHHPHKCSLVASIGPQRGDGSGLVISGHMDVVPTEGQPWTSDPFALTRRGDTVYGRGTADMKGFFACTLQALARLDLTKLQRELVLVWTHDEEVGCLGSAQVAHAIAGRALPTACLIGEPTDFQILRMHPGHVAVEIEIAGKAAHSSRPALGLNAIEAAGDVIRAIRELAQELEAAREPSDPEPRLPVNIAQIEGGAAINIVPDRCVLRVGYRPPPGMAAELVHTAIAARLAELPWPAPISSKILRVTPSLLTPEGTPLEAILAREALIPGTGMATFATDGGNLAKLGVLPLVFGPGSIAVAHMADEHVAIDALVRGVDVVERVVRASCF